MNNVEVALYTLLFDAIIIGWVCCRKAYSQGLFDGYWMALDNTITMEWLKTFGFIFDINHEAFFAQSLKADNIEIIITGMVGGWKIEVEQSGVVCDTLICKTRTEMKAVFNKLKRDGHL